MYEINCIEERSRRNGWVINWNISRYPHHVSLEMREAVRDKAKLFRRTFSYLYVVLC